MSDHRRSGVTILEVFVVLAILALLLAFLLPAVQSSRERARETVCKNNLHQISLAAEQFMELHKRVPGPYKPGVVGGWAIELLPFLEQSQLFFSVESGTPISDAPEVLLALPRIYRCPDRPIDETAEIGIMSNSHYVLDAVSKRKSYQVLDAPIEFHSAWASGPEMRYDEIIRRTGPHHGGFFVVNSTERIEFILNGKRVR